MEEQSKNTEETKQLDEDIQEWLQNPNNDYRYSHCWFSLKAAEVSKFDRVRYLINGELCHITHATQTLEHGTFWDDIVYLGIGKPVQESEAHYAANAKRNFENKSR